VAYSPDGKTLASGSGDKTVKLWDVATGKNTATIKGHTEGVHAVAYSSDGRTLASGSGDGTIKLWDVRAGRAAAK
jgi:WD40 repeat protein